MNLKLYYIDNVKRPYESTSVEESKKLHASRGYENERDADRSALNEAGDLRRKIKGARRAISLIRKYIRQSLI